MSGGRAGGEGLRIGEVATATGVSTRTLRYYEELGLVSPAGHSPGGARRYSDHDVARVQRIRELQELMGFGLDEIGTILDAEDRLARLRSEYLTGTVDAERQRKLVSEAIAINDRLRSQVKERLARAEEFLADLEGKARRYRQVLAEIAEKRPAKATR
jgi:DNA-binding transcriptional MerR regulator